MSAAGYAPTADSFLSESILFICIIVVSVGYNIVDDVTCACYCVVNKVLGIGDNIADNAVVVRLSRCAVIVR